ncbi:MAG: hypothetical protein QM723_31535 [Myxococcaceae bacterium]
MTVRRWLPLLLLLAGCFGEVGPMPAHDSGQPIDSGQPEVDSGQPAVDSGTPVMDSGVVDSGVPDAGMADAGPMDSGVTDAGSGKIPVFIAQGAEGRTIMSCDDGKSWVGDRSWDKDADPLMCGITQTKQCYADDCSYEENNACVLANCCNDTPDVPKGVIYGDGKFVATWGWGQPGAVRTSTNGVDWTTTHPNDSFGGVAYGAGRFLVASRSPFSSADGLSWSAASEADFRNDDGSQMWSVRRFHFADVGSGVFIAVASGNTNRDVMLTRDLGQTWVRPSSLPSSCANIGSEYGGFVTGGGVIVIVDEAGNACRSLDGGDTWTVTATGATQVLSHGVWTGSEFWFWGDDKDLLRSADGATWTKTPMTTPMRLGPIARSPGGTLVSAGTFWDGYGNQQFARSTDGLKWDLLPASAMTQSHPLFYVTFGYADPSADCHL